jgi:hypothetical protein
LIDSRKPFQSTSMIRQPVSESGRLYHGDGGTSGCPPPEGVDVAYPLVLVATGVKMLARRHHAPTIKRIVPTAMRARSTTAPISSRAPSSFTSTVGEVDLGFRHIHRFARDIIFSSAAARFSGDAGASLFVSVMGSNSVGYARRATGLDAPSTLLLANVLDCLLGKGGLM